MFGNIRDDVTVLLPRRDLIHVVGDQSHIEPGRGRTYNTKIGIWSGIGADPIALKDMRVAQLRPKGEFLEKFLRRRSSEDTNNISTVCSFYPPSSPFPCLDHQIQYRAKL